MPAVVAEDVKLPAESSTTETTDVTEASSAPAPEPNLDPSTYTREQVREWKKTGAVPQQAAAEPEPQAASTPATEPAGAPEAKAPGDKPAAESAPAPQQEKKGKNAETRVQELLKERKASKAEADALRAEIEALKTASTAPAKTDVVAAPSPVPVKALPKVEKPVKPVKPVWGEKPEEEWEQFQAREAQYEDQRDEYHLLAGRRPAPSREGTARSRYRRPEQSGGRRMDEPDSGAEEARGVR